MLADFFKKDYKQYVTLLLLMSCEMKIQYKTFI